MATGNAVDGDYFYANMWVNSQNAATNTSSVHWEWGWAFRTPSPTDRDLKDGWFDADGSRRSTKTGIYHANAAQYYNHDILFASGDFDVTHDSAGNRYVSFSGGSLCYLQGNSFNQGSSLSSGFWLPQIGQAPGAPGTPTFSAQKPTGLTVSWTAASSPTSGVVEYEYQRATNSAFTTGVVSASAGNALSASVTGLTPGTTYYFRVRARNSTGWGGYSGTSSTATLSSAPPTISLVAAPNGMAATATLAPPSGVTSVDSYLVEWRVSPSGTVQSITTTTSPVTISPLIPGTSYDFRATMTIGTYVSPASAWSTLIMPNPSTNPGEFFDGNSAAKTDTVYSWSGATNASTSLATGYPPLGWMTFTEGLGASGMSGTVAQATGGQYGAVAARALITRDSTAAGFTFGTGIGTGVNAKGYAATVEGQVYIAQIAVNPSRAGSFTPVIAWFDSSYALLAETVGAVTPAPPGDWTRLVVSGSSPIGTAYAGVRARTAASGWLGGDSILADAAMITLGDQDIPYFDGSFTDTPESDYSWIGTAHNSQSIRTALEVIPPDPLQDPACGVIPAPPRPPMVSDPCIDDVGIWRRYWGEIPASRISDWISVIPTFTARTGALAARQLRVRIYPNPFGYPIGIAPVDQWCSEQIVSYVPANTLLTLDGPLRRVFAEVAGAAAVPADHLLYGSNGGPPVWPELSCGMSYIISFDAPIESPEENLVTHTVLTRRY